ncbi:Cd2+/Zn2+-exporting ATPase [Alicyclobacillus macrosporangiidus]|uniref:Cd(2+)-exporting ATPase n=1 Tax=Alicyclobacillus macrosporangiidus TaxID=392015 RepID=A0A1I7LF72_9BACL|nr:Cd2+/Zn2+-exporting ATPase [Alicyclobacillus macrosporangiidus]
MSDQQQKAMVGTPHTCCAPENCKSVSTNTLSTTCSRNDECCKDETQVARAQRDNSVATRCCADSKDTADNCCGCEEHSEPNVDVSSPATTSESECCSGGCCAEQQSHGVSCCQPTQQRGEPCCGDTHEHGNRSNGGYGISHRDGEHHEYRVYGMDCPACAKTIEKSLTQLQGIQSVVVNYSTGKMRVVGNDKAVFEQIPAQVKKLGYAVEPIVQGRTRTYLIEGMDCGACARTIENHLRKVPGVKTVAVNFSNGKMIIEHDNSVQDIVSEVAKVGYRASLMNENRPVAAESGRSRSGDALIVLSGVLLALGLISTYLPLPPIVPIGLFAACMVIGGYKPARNAYYAVRSRSLDMNVLMTMAALGAAIIGQWAEGASVVWLFALGNVLQNKSIEKTRNSIRSLMSLTPPEAWVKVGSELVRQPVENVGVGDVIVVKPGERIPLDGEVVKGTSSVNQAPITGESIPVDKQVGDPVYAGTINENGSLEIAVTKLSGDSAISHIIHMVEEAQEKKAPTQAFVDKFARVYTPVVFILALLVMAIPPLMGFGTWIGWVYKGLELLVVACPCALVISTPVAIVSAIGNAAKNGVLIKGGTALETAGKITAIAFDKTGTLTEGKPKVSQVFSLETTKEHLLAIARMLEAHSTHSIASAIVQHVQALKIDALQGESFRNIVGKGVTAIVDGVEYFAGNLSLFQEVGAPIQQIEEQIQSLQDEGNTIVIVGTRQQIHGFITVADTVRKTTAWTVQSLKDMGIRQVVMLTGDNEGTAKRIANQTGVDRYYAELLPEDKVNALKHIQDEGHIIAMVGDGINDAPALATANVGIAMGGAGTDTAMETADIVLMSDNLEKLPYTIEVSKRALRIIKENVSFSLVIKFLALLLIFPGWLTLWGAVVSDTGAAIIVILNSMRLLKSMRQS